jgi:hypothetical protein
MKCYNADSKGFAYQPGKPVQPGTTGVGILCLYLLGGDSHGDERNAAARTLAAKPVDDASQFPYYCMYYAAQAAFQAGDPVWKAVTKITNEKLLSTQKPDGGWPDASGESAGAGRLYTTSMALLTLSVSYSLLPVYQR